MSISHFFIQRPVFAAVISIVITIAGGLAILALPIAQYPEIAPPTVQVQATFTGADAATVAKTVATPIEEQVNGVENMLYMSSQNTATGQMVLTVTFKVGTNLDIAQVQVQNRVAIAQPQLPPEVQQSGIVVKKASPDITMVVNIGSPDGKYPPLFVSNFATLQVRDELARLEGVGNIQLFGVRDYSMRLWLNPPQMASRGITTGDVIAAVKEQNVQVAAGTVGGPPLPAGAAAFQLTVNAQGRLTSPEQFRDIVVKVGADGKPVYMKDVARVELGAADYTTTAQLDGKPSVGIAIFQLPGTNSIHTAALIKAKMEELKGKPNWPPGLEYSSPYNTTLFVIDSLRDVVITLLESIALVVLVVIVFLQSWRAAVVPLVAIPVSLIGTFAVMWAFGFSMNTLSLFGLVLAIGIVVDDAIVVVENVERLMDEGYSPREAAFRAMDEVTPAVIAIAFGLSAVFIPVAFISGITGQFYKQFALTISFSTLLSAFSSLTLSPALAALLLRPKTGRQDLFTRGTNLLLGWFFRLFNRGLELTTAAYVGVLRWVVRLTVVALAIYVGLVGLTYVGFKRVPTGFIPSQDQGYLVCVVSLPDGSSIDRTDAVMERLSGIARGMPGVKNTVGISGLNLLTFAGSSYNGAMFITLKPAGERVGHPEQSANALAGAMQGAASKVQEAFTFVLLPPPVQGIGQAGGFKMQIEDRSGQASPADMEKATFGMLIAASQRPEIDPHKLIPGFKAHVPQLYADVNPTMAKQQNVAIADVYNTLQTYLGGFYINDFNYLGRTWHVTAQADTQYRAHASDISQLMTRNTAGAMVPLGAVSQVKEIAGPDRIPRYNLYATAELLGAPAEGHSSGEALAAMTDVASHVLPPGMTFEWTELAYQEVSAGNTALFIFPLCILFVWLTHSAEYESFALSTAIILIVPMCLLCGIAGVYFRGFFKPGFDDNIFTQIGFVVLAGMSVKNAVLIVEFAKQQQEHHPEWSAGKAAIEAARLRLRPILMTSFAFIFGVLPLVIARGAGAEMRQALGTVVFFGMIGVTFFGIFLTPVFFTAIRWVTGHLGFHHGPPPQREQTINRLGNGHGSGDDIHRNVPAVIVHPIE